MTQIKVDTVTNAAGTAAADFADGITVAGAALSTLNTAEYYTSATEPTSPKNGAIWWDTTNEKVMVYIADEFKEVELGASAGGAVEWSVTNMSLFSYDSVSFSVASQETGLYGGPTFSADGTKMYVCGYIADSLFQYTLSTAWDLSTASYDSVSFSTLDGAPTGISLNNDGTKIYYIGYVSDKTYEVDLSTAYDLSTATYNSVSYAHGGGGQASGMTFSTDGTKYYNVGVNNDAVREHTLSTAWDLSTASYAYQFSVSSQTGTPRGVRFNPTGTQMFILGQTDTKVLLYTLSTAWDLSTATYDSAFTNTSSTGDFTGDLFFSSDGSKLYVSSDSTETVYQYSTGL